jgi:hypothetical protein
MPAIAMPAAPPTPPIPAGSVPAVGICAQDGLVGGQGAAIPAIPAVPSFRLSAGSAVQPAATASRAAKLTRRPVMEELVIMRNLDANIAPIIEPSAPYSTKYAQGNTRARAHVGIGVIRHVRA